VRFKDAAEQGELDDHQAAASPRCREKGCSSRLNQEARERRRYGSLLVRTQPSEKLCWTQGAPTAPPGTTGFFSGSEEKSSHPERIDEGNAGQSEADKRIQMLTAVELMDLQG